MQLEGKVAVVTGAASGIGRGIAERFAKAGAAVVIADINGEGAGQAARSLTSMGGKAKALAVDVSSKDSMNNMVNQTLEAFRRLDILVNNAGLPQRPTPLTDTEEGFFDKMFAVNVKSVFLGAKAVAPVMREQGGGNMINTASTAGLRPRPGFACYNASKGAVITLTKSLAVELAPDNIRVNALCPTATETPMFSEFAGGDVTPDIRKAWMTSIPLGRFCTPDDLGAAALFLASDEASNITGVCLEVDGGRCI